MMETAWILDNGCTCVGFLGKGHIDFVPYTDIRAVRFSRECDAKRVLEFLQYILPSCDRVEPVEHSWG
jgi:hypothetical protein